MTKAALSGLLALLAAFAAVPSAAQSPGPDEAVISLDKFDSCGFVSRFSPNKIDPSCFQGLNNAVLDQDLSILRRNGFATYTPTPCANLQSIRGLFPFFGTDGSQYLVMQSSASMYSSKGDGTCTPIVSLNGGLSTTAQMSCVQGMGSLWCSDGVDPVFATNVVTTTANVVGAPLGKYIGFFRNRVMLSGVSGNLTNIYLSGQLNGMDWNLPAVQSSTSPAILNISGTNDGQPVSCLMGEYQNGYYIGRPYDTYLLSGYDLTDFAIRKVDEQIGCMDNNSHQTVNNTLMWLSHRGIESLTGTQINWTSYPIDPTIKVIIAAAGNSQAFVVNANNFTSGNLTASGPGAPVSATIAPGFLTVSSSTFVDNSTATFVNGTLVNVSTYGANVVALSVASNTVQGGNFASAADAAQWTLGGLSSGDLSSANAADGSTFSSINCGLGGKVGTVHCPFGASFCAYNARCSASVGFDNVSILSGATGGSINNNSSGPADSRTVTVAFPGANTSTSTVVCLSKSNSVSNIATCIGSGNEGILENVTTPSGFNALVDVKDYNSNGAFNVTTFANVRISSYPPSGTYTSAAFNTSFSTPTMGTVGIGLSSSAVVPITLQQQNSKDGVTWNPAVTLTQNSVAVSTVQYWRYIENFTTTNGTMTARSNGITSTFTNTGQQGLTAETTAYYITPCVNTSGMSSWGVMSVDAVNLGGSFSFQVSTGATCDSVIKSTSPWAAQTPNAIVTQSTAAFVAVRVLFTIDIATETPSLQDIGLNWNAGASRPNVASAQYQNKYYLFYTTSQASGAANDHAVVYDQNNHWQLFDDVHAASAALYLNQLFLGDSNSTGNVYLFDSGPTDAGGAFTFSFQTPDLDGGDPLAPKTFKRAYLILGAPSGLSTAGSFSCSYALSGSTVTYSLGTVNLSEAPETFGYFTAKFPFPAGQPSTGQWVNLSCTNTGTAGPLHVYGIRLVYTKQDWP